MAGLSPTLRDSVVQGYYRMYWGKRIIEWCRRHQEELEIMINLHDGMQRNTDVDSYARQMP